jgi:Ulp1 family protease
LHDYKLDDADYFNREENIFEKNICLMPIYDDNHYFLVVILLSGIDENYEKEKSCILLFDSLKPTIQQQQKICKTINSFVRQQYNDCFSKDDFVLLPLFNIEKAVKQDDGNACGYCTIFNTQNVVQLILEKKLIPSEENLSSKFSGLITESMKKEMEGYLPSLKKNIIVQRNNARDQLCTWAKYLSSF